jgi:hypothetical protein
MKRVKRLRDALARSRKFLGLLFSFGLWGTLIRGKGSWRAWYAVGLLLFYSQGALLVVVALDKLWRQMPRYLVHAGSFIVLALIATVLLLVVGTEIGVGLARIGLRYTWVLDSLVAVTRFPIVVWVLLLVPALPANARLRLVVYWGIILFLTIAWSVVEIAREIASLGRSDIVYSLKNLGIDDAEIFRTHLLVGSCREFVVAHLFDLWQQLLLIELAMGFGVRYAETLTKAPDLLPYRTSFGYLLARNLETAQEGFLNMKVLFAALVLAGMFLSYWFVQVGVLQMRQAGGIDYLRALRKVTS